MPRSCFRTSWWCRMRWASPSASWRARARGSIRSARRPIRPLAGQTQLAPSSRAFSRRWPGCGRIFPVRRPLSAFAAPPGRSRPTWWRAGHTRPGRGAAVGLSGIGRLSGAWSIFFATSRSTISRAKFARAPMFCRFSTAGRGACPTREFQRWVVAPPNACHGAQERHPSVPIIGFPRGAGRKFERTWPRPLSMA